MRFPDGTQARVIGLDEGMAEFYSEGREPNEETGEEILFRLEKNSNYIPSSARREYRNAILKEYRNYIENQKEKSQLTGGVKDEPRKKDK